MSDLRATYLDGIREVAATARRTAELGYVASHGGNISARLDAGVIAITPTQVPKRLVRDDDVVLIDPDGAVLSAADGRRPTGETPLHTHIFRQRPDATGLVHAHPPLLTGFAIAGCELLSRPLLPEPILEVGPLALVPYAEPLTEELSRAFDPFLPRHNGFLMQNHGALMLAREGAGRALEFLEMMEAAAQSVLAARQLGTLRELSAAEIENLNRTLRTRGAQPPGAPGAVASLSELFT
jgi:L-fuculose-phosphate aldolase